MTYQQEGLVGFSYGGLLGADLFTSYPDVHFNKLALFAPALNCRFCFVLKWLTAFPRLVIPSFASPTYRANRGTPMAAYTALMDTIAHFGSRISSKLNVPTLIFIDPQDELVSHRKLKALVEARHLTNWRFHLLQKEPTGVKTALHHLIIDPSSIGKNQWNEVEKQLIQHLLPAN